MSLQIWNPSSPRSSPLRLKVTETYDGTFFTLNSSCQSRWQTTGQKEATLLIEALQGEAMVFLRTLADDKQKDYQTLKKFCLQMRYVEARLQYADQA